jgi:hypothetical protein
MKKRKKSETPIYDSIRKPIAPKGQRFRTRKDELSRKQKHKGKKEEDE